MAGTRWNSRSGDDNGGIKTDKDLDGDFKKAAEGEDEKAPDSPDKDESKDGDDQPTLEPPGPKLWDKKAQQEKNEPPHNIKKSGPGPK